MKLQWLIGAAAALTLAACADDTRGAQVAGAYEADVPVKGNRLAVLGSDYKSSALSLLTLDTQQRIGAAVWHSGSQVSAATTALSGDVALGQTPSADGRVIVIDRGSAVISFWEPTTRAIQQIPVSTGFYSNPQDAVPISATKLYVVRMKRNPTPTADPADLDDGDDVLIVDPRDGKLMGRIDLAPYASEAGLVAAGSRAVKIGNRVWLPLQSLAADFNHQGPARFIVIDSDKDSVIQVVDAPNIKNCIQMCWLADAQRFVAVCDGAYTDKADQGAHAAVAVVTPGEPTATVLVTADAFAGARTLGRDIACLPGGHCVVTTPGEPDSGTRDGIWRVELTGGKPVKIAEGSGPFAVSGMVAVPGSQRILVGDRTNAAGDVRVFELSATASVELPAIRSNPGGLGAIDFGVF